MSSFILKIIAVVTMIIDHFGYVVFKHFSYFNYIGRIALPLFAFQISEGYSHTRDIKKYLVRLFVFAIVSQVPFMLYEFCIGKEFSFNVLFTFCFALLALIIYDKQENKLVGLAIAILIAVISFFIKLAYAPFGIAIILIFYIFKDKKIYMTFIYILACILNYLPSLIQYNFYYKYIILCICTMLSIIPILLYNGKKGKDIKYFLYLFYPLHLLILFIINKYM